VNSATAGATAADEGVGVATGVTVGAAISSTTAGGTDASVADELGADPATKSLNAATSLWSSTVTMIGTPTEISPDPG
jgi:hypothetical protein